MTGIDEVADVVTFFRGVRSVTTITFWSFLRHVCVEWA